VNPYYIDEAVTLYHGDCIDVMRALPDNSVDAVVTDPPYGINFMGRAWDGAAIAAAAVSGVDHTTTRERSASMHAGTYDLSLKGNRAFGAWCELWAAEAFRVLKPGGHFLAFSSARTWHRLTAAVEDTGFEIRDSIAWMYGSGFPKSLDVSKAIDKAAGAEREVIGSRKAQDIRGGRLNATVVNESYEINITAPATDAAKQWQGWGTALKPAFEPVVVARKPLIGTVAQNVQQYGTGALNIDGCRIGTETVGWGGGANRVFAHAGDGREQEQYAVDGEARPTAGRWPANVILDESQAAELDRQSGVTSSPIKVTRGPDRNPSSFGLRTESEVADCYGDSGGASRFFYTAKASSAERPNVDGVAHPTVKPLELMQYLVRLVTPPGGTVLEPFAGSGTTAEACIVEGFKCIAIEMTDEYLPLIMQRISKPIEMTLL